MSVIFKIFPLVVLMLLQGNSAVTDYELLKHLDRKGDYLTVDDLGNLFLVDKEKLIKFDDNGKLLYTYSNPYNGIINFVDAGDPFKILLYYRDFSQIVFLDKFLSRTTDPVNLESLELELATLACSSYNNGFWVYLPQTFELVRVGQSMLVSHRSGDISSIVSDRINPNFLKEKDNMVYLNDPDIGVMIFDKYGSYFKTIPLKNMQYFQIEGNNLISSSENNIRIYDLKNFNETNKKLPEENPLCINIKYSFNPKRLFLLNERGINIYSVNLDK